MFNSMANKLYIYAKRYGLFYIIHYKSMMSFKINSMEKIECLITYFADTYKEYFSLKAACALKKISHSLFLITKNQS